MVAKNSHPELIEKLTEGVANLTSTEEWQRYLKVQSRFHHYSFGNAFLIASQRPDASWVAGFNAWRRMGRVVRKGERAIWILAPIICSEKPAVSDEEAEEGEETEREPKKVLRGFRFVPVFDIAQTEGKELPTPCNRIFGDDPGGCYDALVVFAKTLGFRVEDHEFNGTKYGDCNHQEHLIRVRADIPPAQRIKTLAHEIAHAMLHETFDDRAVAELEAESIAYIVCQNFGIDSGDYSFGYVASWGGGSEGAISAIKKSCGCIQRTAAAILDGCEVGIQRQAA
jgi:hypothetical protein